MMSKPPNSKFLNAEPSFSIHKIIYFLDCCRSLDIPDENTFPLTDLMIDDGDPRAIIKTLLLYEETCRKKGWNGPPIPIPPNGYFQGPYQISYVAPPAKPLTESSPRFSQMQSQATCVYQSLGGSETKKVDASNRFGLERSHSFPLPIREESGSKPIYADNESESSPMGNIVEQLLDQEELLLKDLTVVLEWRAIMVQNTTLSHAIQETLFCNVDSLFKLHSVLFSQMRQNQEPEGIGKVLSTYAGDILSEHQRYHLNYSALCSLLDRRNRNSSLQDMLSNFLKWPKSHALSLESYLFRVYTVVYNYASKLSELIKRNVGGPTTMQRAALETLSSVISSIESQKQLSRSVSLMGNHVPSVVDGVDVDLGFGTDTLRRKLHTAVDISSLESSSRRFICQGSVWEVVGPGQVKVRSLLLFHDVVVLAKEVEGEKYEVRNILDLQNVTMRSSRDRKRQSLRLRPVVAQAVEKFNSNPEIAVEYLLRKNVLDVNPCNIASFLHKTPNLSRQQVGKFIGTSQNETIARAYAEWFTSVFASVNFQDALRLYLASIRLSNDGSAIDRVLTSFAIAYFKSNPTLFDWETTAVNMVFSTILLNADLHGSTSLGGTAPLSMREFVNTHPGVAPLQLQEVYQSIAAEKLAMASDEKIRTTVDVNAFPTYLTLHEQTEWITIKIPLPDPNFTLRVLGGTDIQVEPSEISFAKDAVQHVRLTGKTLGRKRVFFLPGGSSQPKYEFISPLTITVEPGYMKHTFSLEFPVKKPSNSTGSGSQKLTLTFSVATSEQRQRWVNYISSAVEQLRYR
jgi:hypothetical protein